MLKRLWAGRRWNLGPLLLHGIGRRRSNVRSQSAGSGSASRSPGASSSSTSVSPFGNGGPQANTVFHPERYNAFASSAAPAGRQLSPGSGQLELSTTCRYSSAPEPEPAIATALDAVRTTQIQLVRYQGIAVSPPARPMTQTHCNARDGTIAGSGSGADE
jgi:hypothetical protein